MYLVGFFDRILKYCLSSDISRKKVFFDSPNNEMEKENCRCRFWSNSWSKMGHGVELLDLGHLMVLSHSMHFLDIKGVAHARQRWTLIVSIPCGINKLPNRVSLLNTLYCCRGLKRRRESAANRTFLFIAQGSSMFDWKNVWFEFW